MNDDSYQHEFQEFYDLAVKTFGEKFTMKPIQISDEELEKFNKEFGGTVAKEDFEKYEAVWILENRCPSCGSELDGLFGSFEWGIIHGVGRCCECKKVSIRAYHYIKDSKRPFVAYSLVGF